MEGRNFGQNFDVVPLPDGDSHTLNFAHAVADEDQRVFEAAEIKSAGGMGEMVGDGDEFFIPTQIAEMLRENLFLDSGCEDFFKLAAGEIVSLKGGFMRFVGEAVGDVVYLFGCEISGFEAVTNGIDWKRACGFLACEPFFGRRGKHPFMPYQCR